MSEARFGRIVLGYFGSSFILFSALIASIWLLHKLDQEHWLSPYVESAESLLIETGFISFITFFIAWIPWSPFVALAEIFQLRHWSYHVLTGSAVLLARFWYLGGGFPSASDDEFISHPYVNQAVITYGAIAGLLYWLIAGRKSGSARIKAEPIADRPA